MNVNRFKYSADFAFWLGLFGIFPVTWSGFGQNYNYFFIGIILMSTTILRIKSKQKAGLKGVHLLAVSVSVATVLSSLFISNNSETLIYLKAENLSEIFFLVSEDSSNEFTILAKWLVSLYTLPAFVVLVRRQSCKNYIRILFCWTLSVSISAGVSVLQSFGVLSNAPFLVQTGVSSGRFAGLTNHPNSQAVLLCLTIPIVLILWRMEKLRLFHFVMISFLLEYAIWLTGSRNGIITSTIVIVLIFLKQYKSISNLYLSLNRIIVLLVIVLIIILTGGLTLVSQTTRLGLSIGALDTDASSQGHYALMRYGLEIFMNYPVVGIGPSVLKTFHNIYIQIAGSFGLVGLSTFMLYIRNLWRIDFSREFKFEYRLIVLVFLVYGLLNNNLADFWLYLPLGLCYSTSLDVNKQKL